MHFRFLRQASLAIGSLLKFTFKLRPSPEVERLGLDVMEHGEEGYILEA